MMTAIEATQPAEPAAPCESLQPPPLCVMEPVINASCVPTCPSSGDIDDLGNPSTSVYNGDLWSMDPTPTPTIDAHCLAHCHWIVPLLLLMMHTVVWQNQLIV